MINYSLYKNSYENSNKNPLAFETDQVNLNY